MKALFLSLVLGLCLTACGPLGSGGGGGTPSADYASCEALPAGIATERNACPGAVGTWNNYHIEKDSSGAVITFDLWCGGPDVDHPSDQVAYDSYMIPSGYTSSGDYKSASDCVSGSSEDSSGNLNINIWQKVK